MAEMANGKMSNMSWLCAVFIVIIHVNNIAEPADLGGVIFRGVTGCLLTPIAVPFFFFASGWFLGKHVKEDGWWRREFRKRVKSLLVPFILFCATGFLVGSAARTVQALLHGKSISGLITPVAALSAIGFNPFEFPGHQVFWFVRALMVMMLLAPFLVHAIRKVGLWCPVVLMLVAMSIQSWIYVGEATPVKLFFKTTLNDAALGFFTLGLYWRMSGRRVIVERKTAILLAVIGLAFCALRMFVIGRFLPSAAFVCMNPMVICLVFAFLCFMPSCPLPFAWTSFAVYVLHTYFTGAIAAYGDLPPRLDLGYIFAVTALAIALAMGTAWLLREYVPSVAKVLFGGRVGR